MTAHGKSRAPRWHIAVFLAPAMIIYTAVMLLPLVESLWRSFYNLNVDRLPVFVGFDNYVRLFTDPNRAERFWNAFQNNSIFFVIIIVTQNVTGIFLAALLSLPRLRGRALYLTAFFFPTMLSFVIVGFVWKLLLNPTWGVAKSFLSAFGLGSWAAPWLGHADTALITLALISVWQFVGIPMLLIYAALISIPDELIEAANCEGVVGLAQFFKVKLPLIWPAISIASLLTFVDNFSSFDLIFVSQGGAGGPNYSTDLMGLLLYRTYFGFGMQPGDPYMGATLAGVMFAFIFAVVVIYLIAVQRRISHYSL